MTETISQDDGPLLPSTVTAHHEAGHAIAALVLAADFDLVTIDPDAALGIDGGLIRAVDDDARRNVMIALAGPEAGRLELERVLLDAPNRRLELVDDYRDACEQDEIDADLACPDEQQRRAWGAEAVTLVSGHRDAVERLATLLRTSRTVTYSQAKAAFQAAKDTGRAAAREIEAAA